MGCGHLSVLIGCSPFLPSCPPNLILPCPCNRAQAAPSPAPPLASPLAQGKRAAGKTVGGGQPTGQEKEGAAVTGSRAERREAKKRVLLRCERCVKNAWEYK